MEFWMMNRYAVMLRVMMGLVAVLLSSQVQAKTYSVTSSPEIVPSVEFNLDGQATNQRLCFYENKAYSLGAIIVIDGVILECVAESSIETNGRLMWKKLISSTSKKG
ncbi:DUF1496 domain-containing protein [Photobacterium leiognathi subsp. mandapamensis]|nr:DUF1496 domain-containing protein [Photobacterium leiognathi subsp. mandapamensis]